MRASGALKFRKFEVPDRVTIGWGLPNLALGYLKWVREEYLEHWLARESHQNSDTFLLNRDFSWDLVISDTKIWSGEGRLYLDVRSWIMVHHDHFGIGTDLRIYTACLKEAWDGPRQLIWDMRDRWQRWEGS